MSASIIQANYEDLDTIAHIFTERADNTADTLRLIQTRMEALQDEGWMGQGADAFFAEMEEDVLPRVRRLIDALDQANRTTLQIIRIMQEAEEDAGKLFQGGGIGTGVKNGKDIGTVGKNAPTGDSPFPNFIGGLVDKFADKGLGKLLKVVPDNWKGTVGFFKQVPIIGGVIDHLVDAYEGKVQLTDVKNLFVQVVSDVITAPLSVWDLGVTGTASLLEWQADAISEKTGFDRQVITNAAQWAGEYLSADHWADTAVGGAVNALIDGGEQAINDFKKIFE